MRTSHLTGAVTSAARVSVRLLVATLALLLAVFSLPAAPATAATTVGQLFTPVDGCGGPITAIQTGAASGASYTIPSPGVITSWTFQEGSAIVPGLKLKVGRSAGGTSYTIIGESVAGPQTSFAPNTYPARISVKANDQIGIFSGAVVSSGGCASNTGDSGDTYVVVTSDVSPNTTASFLSGFGTKFPVSAVVEPDVDQDGFGDETQDKCPTEPGPGPCFGLGKAKLNKRKGTATLTVSVPGPGTLALKGKGLVKQRPADSWAADALAKAVSAGGEVKLKIKARGKKKRKLNRTGTVKVKAKVTYTDVAATTGAPINPKTKRERIKLIKQL
jgi:hypothetical protein